MCDYTYFDTERNCIKWKLELMRYHLVVGFCIIMLTVYIPRVDKYVHFSGPIFVYEIH